MGFKPRGYKREVPTHKLRDYSLFAIACEGEKTEPSYFDCFNTGIDSIKVDIIEYEEGKHNSSPKAVLDKAATYANKYKLCEENDSLWLVIDVDRWTRDSIDALFEACLQEKNWNLIISNPCFEIWLLYHNKETLESYELETPQEVKKLANLQKLSTHCHLDYIPHMKRAIVNAKANDLSTLHYYPNKKETKVYKLAEALIERMGINRYNNFIDVVIPRLREEFLAKR